MIRQDYELIGEILFDEKSSDGFDAAWECIVESFADGFEREDENFNREQFLEACGYRSEDEE